MVTDKSPRKRTALIATFTFPPDLNGVAEASAACARALLEDGWKVDIAAPPSKYPRTSPVWECATVHEFNILNDTAYEPSRGKNTEKYRSFLALGDWDVIIFQGYFWPLRLALPLLSSLSARKVLISHGHAALRWFPMARFPFGLGQWSRSVIAAAKMPLWSRHIDRWVFLSEQKDFDAYFDHMLAKLIGHSGRRVIPNGVEVSPLVVTGQSFRRRHGISPTACVFLCIAYYSRGKDQGFAVRAFRRANVPGSMLVFIGTEFNEWSKKFQAIDASFVNDRNLGRILWLEKLTRSDTLDVLTECDVFVLPSHLETQPISILEAMARSKPWIARKAGCVARLPGGICVRSVKSMANAMSLMATNRSVRTRLGRHGHQAAQQTYSREKYFKYYQQLLDELVPQKNQA